MIERGYSGNYKKKMKETNEDVVWLQARERERDG